MGTQLETAEAVVRIEELGDGRRRISVEPKRGDFYIHGREWVTAYPPDLIRQILAAKGPDYAVDEIKREESPDYVQQFLETAILAYVDPAEVAGRKILDFGCGCGASSVVMARLLPGACITGVELVEEFASIARARAALYGLENARFLVSSRPDALPDGIGPFDFVTLNAVYEHLLPGERASLLPMLWDRMKPGGILFLNQTPNRVFPVEVHTTGLPLVNYLPDRLAHWFVGWAWSRMTPDDSWEVLLRKGIRGATRREIAARLSGAAEPPEFLAPSRLGLEDHVDVWFRISCGFRPSRAKQALRAVLKAAQACTGADLSPHLFLAIKKGRRTTP